MTINELRPLWDKKLFTDANGRDFSLSDQLNSLGVDSNTELSTVLHSSLKYKPLLSKISASQTKEQALGNLAPFFKSRQDQISKASQVVSSSIKKLNRLAMPN